MKEAVVEIEQQSEYLSVHGESRRCQILRVVTSLFGQNGYDRVGMRDIASAIGITTGSLYHYFAGKEEMLAEIMLSGLRKAVLEYEGALRCTSDPVKQLDLCVKLSIKRATSRPEEGLLASSEIRSLSLQHKAEVTALRDRIQGIFEDIIRRGMQERQFAKGDAKLLTYAVFGIVRRIPLWYTRRRVD